MRNPSRLSAWALATLLSLTCVWTIRAQQPASIVPSRPVHYAGFTLSFTAEGGFTLQGKDWPTFIGTWKADNDELTLQSLGGPKECAGPGRYRLRTEGTRLLVSAVTDECVPRRMILNDSRWLPEGETDPVPERRIVRTGPDRPPSLPTPSAPRGSWPSFRGPNASGIAEGQN